MDNAIEDVSKLTSIPYKTLCKLFDLTGLCICNSVYTALLDDCKTSEINLEFGKLVITVRDEKVIYEFIPSKNFEEQLVTTINENKNPLEIKLEDTLADRITKTFKDLI